MTTLIDQAPEGQREALSEVLAERLRQDDKWGTDFPRRSHHKWMTILTEEVGEIARGVLSLYHGENGVEPLSADAFDALRDEVVQVAAVCLSWLEKGEWDGAQHREWSVDI